GGESTRPADVVVDPTASRDDPWQRWLSEFLDHFCPGEVIVGVDDGDAGALVTDQANVVPGGDPARDLVPIARQLPGLTDGALRATSEPHHLPAVGTDGGNREVSVGHVKASSATRTTPSFCERAASKRGAICERE